MARYINAEDLKNVFKSGVRVYDGICSVNDIIHNIDNEPTADVAEAKHGKWEEEYLGCGVYRFRCSECNSTCGEDMINQFHHKNYCSDCGAKMV